VKTGKKDKRSPVAQPLGSWHGDPNDVMLNYSQKWADSGCANDIIIFSSIFVFE
jgi:hypothetical protein